MRCQSAVPSVVIKGPLTIVAITRYEVASKKSACIFGSEHELRQCKSSMACTRSAVAGDYRVPRTLFEPWFKFAEAQVTCSTLYYYTELS